MGRTCSTYGQKKIYKKTLVEKPEELDNLEDVSADWRIS